MPDQDTSLLNPYRIQLFLLAFAAASSCCCAIFAGLSRLRSSLQICLACLPAMLLIFMRAYEPFAILFLAAMLLTVAARVLRTYWNVKSLDGASHHTNSLAQAKLPQWQLSLASVLLGTTLLGIALGIFRQLPWQSMQLTWTVLLFDGCLLSLLGFTTLAVVAARGRLAWIAGLFGCVVAAILVEMKWGDALALTLLESKIPEHSTSAALSEFSLYFVLLSLFGISLYLWQAPAGERVVSSQRQRWALAAGAFVVTPLVTLYAIMLVDVLSTASPATGSNALPRLVELAISLEEADPWRDPFRIARTAPTRTPEKSAEIAALLEESLRTAKQPGHIHIDWADYRPGSEDPYRELELLKRLAFRWALEGERERAAENYSRAAQFDLAIIRLSRHLGRGGLMVHTDAALELANLGTRNLGLMRHDLTSELLPETFATLASLDDRDSLRVQLNRQHMATGTWRTRLAVTIERIFALPSEEHERLLRAQRQLTREVTQRRLLATELAVQQFKQAENRFPDYLRELVPRYFGQVPVDPCTQRDLVYRVTDRGYVLYSTGPDGINDGGKFRRTQFDLAMHGGSDWNLDSLILTPAMRIPTGPGQHGPSPYPSRHDLEHRSRGPRHDIEAGIRGQTEHAVDRS